MEECIICFEEKLDFRFYTCGHKLCTQCYHKINTCPLCQSTKIEVVVIQPTSIQSIQTTYNSIRCFTFLLLTTVIVLYFYNY